MIVIDGKYAPNPEDPPFFHNVNNIIGAMANGDIIMGGDFNQIIDNY